MPQTEAAASNVSQFSVSELANALKNTLEDQFGYVRVRGEISGYRGPHTSGHAYFTLKDESARLDAVIWRTSFQRLRVKPQEGLEVVASGRLSIYAGKSSYQIIVESLEPAGVGALMALLEARRRQLAAEGLFEQGRKRPLPFLPRVIGVVTSPSGSVIRDILHRLADRFPTRVLIWPVRVQGEGSAEEVTAAIRGFNALSADSGIERPDVLIVARGGGSLEDLWGFNEEMVVRAAAESAIPLISAVGHETDWTLLDHVADYRAPTPTAAAEISAPVRSELVARVAQLEARSVAASARLIAQNLAHMRAAARGLPSPNLFLVLQSQRFDAACQALKSQAKSKLSATAKKWAQTGSRLNMSSPSLQLTKTAERFREVRIKLNYAGQQSAKSSRQALLSREVSLRFISKMKFQKSVESISTMRKRWESKREDSIRNILATRKHLRRSQESLAQAAANNLQRWTAKSGGLFQLFASVNYKAVLARGFALVLDKEGAPIARRSETTGKKSLIVRFADGDVAVSLDKPKPAGRSSKRTSSPDQTTLF